MWTDDGRTTEASHPISSPGAFGSGELKTVNVVRVLNLCTCPDVLYICTKLQENTSKAFRVIERMGFVY